MRLRVHGYLQAHFHDFECQLLTGRTPCETDSYALLAARTLAFEYSTSVIPPPPLRQQMFGDILAGPPEVIELLDAWCPTAHPSILMHALSGRCL